MYCIWTHGHVLKNVGHKLIKINIKFVCVCLRCNSERDSLLSLLLLCYINTISVMSVMGVTSHQIFVAVFPPKVQWYLHSPVRDGTPLKMTPNFSLLRTVFLRYLCSYVSTAVTVLCYSFIIYCNYWYYLTSQST